MSKLFQFFYLWRLPLLPTFTKLYHYIYNYIKIELWYLHFSPSYQEKWCRVVKFSQDNVRMKTGKIHKVIYSTAETRDNKVCLRKFLLHNNNWNKRVQIISLIYRGKKVRTNDYLPCCTQRPVFFLILIRNKKNMIILE